MLFIFGCSKKGKNNDLACNGNTRREVKILIDSSVTEIDTTIIETTIDSIGHIEVIEPTVKTPRQEIEKKVFRLTGIVDKVKRERDGDYHIKLVDENENYIITECPNPKCDYAINSPYIDRYNIVREFIESNLNELEGKTVTITGVAFIDIDHHYKRKQAENNIELHPILDISF
ncbi:MAG: hypothetical protein ACWA41_11435 [Putridiphycobacter sp.]